MLGGVSRPLGLGVAVPDASPPCAGAARRLRLGPKASQDARALLGSRMLPSPGMPWAVHTDEMSTRMGRALPGHTRHGPPGRSSRATNRDEGQGRNPQQVGPVRLPGPTGRLRLCAVPRPALALTPACVPLPRLEAGSLGNGVQKPGQETHLLRCSVTGFETWQQRPPLPLTALPLQSGPPLRSPGPRSCSREPFSLGAEGEPQEGCRATALLRSPDRARISGAKLLSQGVTGQQFSFP